MSAWWFFLLPLSFVLSWMIGRGVLQQAARFRLIQHPNLRSSHSVPTPSGGGLGIVVASLLVGFIIAWTFDERLWWSLLLGIPLALVGFLDDVRQLPVTLRLLLQLILVAGFLALWWSPENGGPPLSWMMFLPLLLLGVWWVNLFNFMDGVDGLAGMQAVFMLLATSGLTIASSAAGLDSPFLMFCICVASATLGFLLLNWPPATIFMGDTGSLWLAFTIFSLAIYSVENALLSCFPWLILAAVFATDASVTLSVRVLRGGRWYEAHRSHVYQRLARYWSGQGRSGHRMVTMMALVVNSVYLFPLAWVSVSWPQYAITCLLLAYVPLCLGAVFLGAGRSDNA